MNNVRQENFELFSSDNEKLLNVIKFIESRDPGNNEKVSVVSIIGKSTMDAMSFKAGLISSLVDKNMKTCNIREKTTLCSDKIDGYYDVDNRIIFLHLSSIMDSCGLTDLYREMSKHFVDPGFIRLWPQFLMDLLKSLLLLFHISHIVMITSQTPRFDLSYINMFRIVDSMRTKLQPFSSEMLQTFSGLPMLKTGRPFVPQLLFVFNAYNSAYHYLNQSNLANYTHQLEEQMIRIFRKSRLLTNINPLFHLNTNSPLKSFVFISINNPNIANFSEYFFQKIFERCADREIHVDDSATKHQDIARTDVDFLTFFISHINSISSIKSENTIKQPSGPLSASLSIRILLGFKDLIFSAKHSNFSVGKEKNLATIFESLAQTLDVDERFSEMRCSKMVTKAVSYYQEGLPSHYNRETHERKIMLAIQNFTMQCRGPAIYKYIQTVKSECEKYWNNSRKMCEALSLTGSPCLNKLHLLPSDDIPEYSVRFSSSAKNLPFMLHNSMAKIISACDCGRRQGNREDPFTTKSANCAFYQKMKFKCHTCADITRINFPFYDINKIDYDSVSNSQTNVIGTRRSDESLKKTNSPVAGTAGLSLDEEVGGGDSLEHFLNEDDAILSQLGALDLASEEGEPIEMNEVQREENEPQDNQDEQMEDEEGDDDGNGTFTSEDEEGEEEDAQQRADTGDSDYFNVMTDSAIAQYVAERDGTEDPLPPMLTTDCRCIVARFSSWSLVCLGSSRIYSHNVGIQDQQGFISGSNFLLPWNVTIMLQHGRRMPMLWEGKRPPGIKHKKTLRDGTQFTVKIFIGVEYECFKGHRFICSGPDHVLKANSNGFKETANQIATNDMPLYTYCPCSTSKSAPPVVAQLMRLHIVTPKAPIHVTLDPKVQMTRAKTFYPGNREPIRLTQSSYWVLRLPMIYEALEGGPLPFPTEPPFYCRLLKDCYGIADQVTEVRN